jgi:hypothetical protein
MGALVLYSCSRLPLDSGLLNLHPKKMIINLIRDVPFPEPTFICLSKVPVNNPLPGSPNWGPYEESCPFQEPSLICLSNFSAKVRLKKTHPSLEGPRKGVSPPVFSKMGPLWKQTDISRALYSISSGVPSKGTLPTGSPHRASTKSDAPFPKPFFIHLSKSLVNELLSGSPKIGTK